MTAIRTNARGEVTIPWHVAGAPDLDIPKTLAKMAEANPKLAVIRKGRKRGRR